MSDANRYLNELVKMPRGGELLTLRLFPNAKEVTESFAAYHAVRRHLPHLSLGDRFVTLVAVGDGTTPRTGALFALRSAWRCESIDPRLRWTSRVDRLGVWDARAEDVVLNSVTGPAIVVAVHSHAPLEAALATVPNASSVAVVAIPCCVPHELPGQPPDVSYEDDGILSPERRVLVWTAVRRAS